MPKKINETLSSWKIISLKFFASFNLISPPTHSLDELDENDDFNDLVFLCKPCETAITVNNIAAISNIPNILTTRAQNFKLCSSPIAMTESHILTVKEEESGLRIDKFLSTRIPELSRSRIQALIKQGAVSQNGQNVTDRSASVKQDDKFIIQIPEIKEPEMVAADIPLNIVFEDDHMLVVNKQAGLIVHPGAGNYDSTMANALLHHCGDTLSGIGGVQRPGIVHRLDKDTTGLMVVAKHDAAHQSLSEQIQSRTLKRVYRTIVWGLPSPAFGKIDANIVRNNKDRKKMVVVESGGRHAITHYKVLEVFKDTFASLVECKLETGRTHQIRVHFQHIKHHLMGDSTYGTKNKPMPQGTPEDIKKFLRNFPRQALHSQYISFEHPKTGEIMEFTADYPADFQELLSKIRGLQK